MSQAARIVLGVAMLGMAAGFLALVPYMKDVSPQAGPGMAVCGLFSGLIAVACLSTASQPVTIRIIGATVFVLSAWYVVSSVLAYQSFWAEVESARTKSRPGILNSIGFLILVGLPSAYAAWKGRYPGWGSHAAAFGADPARSAGPR